MAAPADTSASLLTPLASAEGILFLILSLGIVGLATFCMTRKNPVTAVMSLVGTFFGLAALYATLSAHFLAVLQVLVYAGAIMVLFIFVVMILNREESTLVSLRGLPTRVLGVGAGVYLMATFVRVVIPATGAGLVPGASPGLVPAPVSPSFGTVASVGDMLFRQFVFPFEAISLLLLVAIVGGVVVSRSARKESDATLAAEKRIAMTELSRRDYPAAADGADPDHPSHASGGGHH